MRLLKYAILGLIALLLVALAFANRDPVTLELMPAALVEVTGFQQAVTLPLFLVLLLAVALGLLVGYILEWLREHKHRRAAERRRREVNRLARENERMRRERHEGVEQEVLAILDAPPSAPGRAGPPAVT